TRSHRSSPVSSSWCRTSAPRHNGGGAMRIYVACGLTHVPREHFAGYADFIHQLASKLRQMDPPNEVKYALLDSDPQLAGKPTSERARLCYLWDRAMVEEADLVVADASYPSMGVGIEIQVAEAKNIPVVLSFSEVNAKRAPPVRYENPDHSVHDLQ